MFDIGFAELLIVAVVALIVLGPDKLPTAARAMGMWIGRIKRTLGGIQAEISEELRLEELKRTAAIQKEQLDKELADMQTPFGQAFDDESPMSTSARTTSGTAEAGPAAVTERETSSNSMQQKSGKE